MIKLRVPASKSETQRALVIAALARGESRLLDPLDCDDSRVLRTALRACGVSTEELKQEQEESWLVQGGALRAPATTVHCGEAGSVLRFLAPLALHLRGELLLDGAPRLRERPVAELLRALEVLGVHVRYLAEPGALPFALQRQDQHSSPDAHHVKIDASRSSQFASGLLLSAPVLDGGLRLELSGKIVSRPYLDLTLRMMRSMGARIEESATLLTVAPGGYQPGPLRVSGDWSSAAFLLAASSISKRRVEIENLSGDSAQGDRVIVDFLSQLARPEPHRFDLTDCPDLLPPLAAAAALADQPSEIVGIAHARLKESDRPHVLATRFSEAGLRVVEEPDCLRLQPGGRLRAVPLDPAGDHRMAMTFGLLSLREPGISVGDPDCVSKSYPGFWKDLDRFR